MDQTHRRSFRTIRSLFKRQKNRLDTAVDAARKSIRSSTRCRPGEPFVVPCAASIRRERDHRSASPQPIAGDQAKPVAVDVMRKTQTGKDRCEHAEISEELGEDRVPARLRAAEEELATAGAFCLGRALGLVNDYCSSVDYEAARRALSCWIRVLVR